MHVCVNKSHGLITINDLYNDPVTKIKLINVSSVNINVNFINFSLSIGPYH